MKFRTLIGPVACLASFVIVSSANAELVTFRFKGVIDDAGTMPAIRLGDRFFGEIAWESNTDTGTGQAIYFFRPPLTAPGAHVSVNAKQGRVEFAQDPLQSWAVYVIDNFDLASNGILVDEIQYFSNLESPIPNIQFRLRDTDTTALSSTALPATIDLSQFELAMVTLATPSGDYATGRITDLKRVNKGGQ